MIGAGGSVLLRASFHLPATLHEYHFRPNPVRVKVCEMQRANDEAQVMFTVQKRRLLLQGVPGGSLATAQARLPRPPGEERGKESREIGLSEGCES